MNKVSMKHFHLFIFILVFPLLAHSQAYQEYLDLNYQEIDTLAKIEEDQHNYEQAILYYQAAYEKAAIELEDTSSTYAKYTYKLASLYEQTSNYKLALPFAIQFKDILEKRQEKERPAYINGLSVLIHIYRATGVYEEALSYGLQAQDIAVKIFGKEHAKYAYFINDLALTYYYNPIQERKSLIFA